VPQKALTILVDTLGWVRHRQPEAIASGGKTRRGLAAAQNYQSVHELLISLSARPYEKLPAMRSALRIASTLQMASVGAPGADACFRCLFLIFQLREKTHVLPHARKDAT